jgi:hypothetical protein
VFITVEGKGTFHPSDYVKIESRRKKTWDSDFGVCEIKGKVVDTDGEAVQGAYVWVLERNKTSPAGMDYAKHDGSFIIGNLLAGTYYLGAMKEGYAFNIVQTDISEDTENLSIVLTKGARVTFNVVDEEGKALEKAYIALARKFDECLMLGLGQMTDASGTAILKKVPSGQLKASVSAEGYAPKAVSFKVPGETALTVTMEKGISVTLKVTCAGMSFAGKKFSVKDDEGCPMVLNFRGYNGVLSGNSDFHIKNIMPGTYRFIAHDNNMHRIEKNFTVPKDGPGKIEIDLQR